MSSAPPEPENKWARCTGPVSPKRTDLACEGQGGLALIGAFPRPLDSRTDQFDRRPPKRSALVKINPAAILVAFRLGLWPFEVLTLDADRGRTEESLLDGVLCRLHADQLNLTGDAFLLEGHPQVFEGLLPGWATIKVEKLHVHRSNLAADGWRAAARGQHGRATLCSRTTATKRIDRACSGSIHLTAERSNGYL